MIMPDCQIACLLHSTCDACAAAVAHADPSNRVAVQLSLLLANIARFDFPGRAPDLLDTLMAAATWPAHIAAGSAGGPPPQVRCAFVTGIAW